MTSPEVFRVKTGAVHFLKRLSRKYENASGHIRWPLIIFILAQRDEPFAAFVSVRSRVEDKAGKQFNIRRKFDVEIQEISRHHLHRFIGFDLEFSLVEFTQLLFIFFEIFWVVHRVTKECKDVLHRNVEVVIDEKVKLASNAVFLAPANSVHCLDCVVEIFVDKIKLQRYERKFQRWREETLIC